MKTHAIAPAVLTVVADPKGGPASIPYAELFQDIYHAAAGAFEQAEHVFLRGNDLPGRWQVRDRFVILETGFGLGNNFLATWAAWRRDPQRCERLVFVSIEKHPLTHGDLAHMHADSPEPELAQALIDSWPALTPNLHTLTFDQGLVQLLLAFGDVSDMLRHVSAEVDAFYLDGFSPAKNPDMWSESLFKRLSKLAARDATAATWSFARSVRDGLTAAGFVLQRAEGFAGKRDMLKARFQPRFVPPRPPGIPRTPACERRALVIGAGLAGCAAAWALREQGWQATVIDRHDGPAREASGNPAGLFHGVIHGDDGPHARLHRAAALTAIQVLRPWIEQGRIEGQCRGLLRLDSRLDSAQARLLIDKLGLPERYVSWLDQPAAEALTGLHLPSGGWLFAGGGWVNPAQYAATLLADSGATFLPNRPIARLTRANGLWHACLEDGSLVAQAPVAVVAGGSQANTLLDGTGAADLHLESVRGQVSWLSATADGVRSPRIPVAGGGYVIRTQDDRLVFGASSHRDDTDPLLRDADHQSNIEQARELGAINALTALPVFADDMAGRVGWRAVTPDRLPLVGPLERVLTSYERSQLRRIDHPRHLPRLQDDAGGLYVVGGLGSRGITFAALAGRVLAAWVTGAPAPVESDLLYAIDPTRFVFSPSPR